MYIDTIKKRKKGNTNAAKKKEGKSVTATQRRYLYIASTVKKRSAKKKAPHPCDSAKLIE